MTRDSDKKYEQRMLAARAGIEATGARSTGVAIERHVVTFEGVIGGVVEKVRVFPYCLDPTRYGFGGMQGIDDKYLPELLAQGDPFVLFSDHVSETCFWARIRALLTVGECHNDRGVLTRHPIHGTKGGASPKATPQHLWAQHYVGSVGAFGKMSPETAAALRDLWTPVSIVGKKRKGEHEKERHGFEQSQAAALDWQSQGNLVEPMAKTAGRDARDESCPFCIRRVFTKPGERVYYPVRW